MQTYLLISLKSLTMTSLTNRRMVFDLDSTLIHSSMDMNEYEALKLYTDPASFTLRGRVYRFDLVDVTDTPGSGVVTPMWGVFRPYVFEFLQFAVTYFKEVYIWSAGQYKYVHLIKNNLFSGTFQPAKIFTYENCKMDVTSIHKPLEELYASLDDGANETNTLALDDREDTFSLNPYNGIQIPAYEPEFTKEGIMKTDVALLQLMCWLSLPEVMRMEDVRYLDKRYIFTTPIADYHQLLERAISPKSPTKTLPPQKVSPPTRSKVASFFPSFVQI